MYPESEGRGKFFGGAPDTAAMKNEKNVSHTSMPKDFVTVVARARLLALFCFFRLPLWNSKLRGKE